MAAKEHMPEEINRKLRGVGVMLGQGGTTAWACRRIAVRGQTPAFARAGSITGGARNMAA